MRSDWTRQARYLFVNFAPFAVHTHEDILSFECYADSTALAIGPGIAPEGYGVAAHAEWYRAARGHNMLCVEEADPIRHLAQGEDVAWYSGSDLDFFAATHRGYAEEFGVIHRRHIIFVKPRYWLIYDRVWAARSGLCLDWFFHSPLTLEETGDGWCSGEGPGLSLLAADAARYERRRGAGPADLLGLPDEPAHRAVNWVSFRWTTRGGSEPEEIAVLIYPGQEAVRLTRLADAGDGARFRVETGTFRHEVVLSHARAEWRRL